MALYCASPSLRLLVVTLLRFVVVSVFVFHICTQASKNVPSGMESRNIKSTY